MPMCMIFGSRLKSIRWEIDEGIVHKVQTIDNLPKAQEVYVALRPVIGRDSMITLEGERWRRLRKMFNPAFSQAHLDKLVSGIVEQTLVFVQKLDESGRRVSYSVTNGSETKSFFQDRQRILQFANCRRHRFHLLSNTCRVIVGTKNLIMFLLQFGQTFWIVTQIVVRPWEHRCGCVMASEKESLDLINEFGKGGLRTVFLILKGEIKDRTIVCFNFFMSWRDRTRHASSLDKELHVLAPA